MGNWRFLLSPLVRGEWIEMFSGYLILNVLESPLVRGEWIEMLDKISAGAIR